MHQIAPQIRLTALPLEPARKIGLEERDFAHIATGILDSITKSFGRQCFRLIVHCPANNDLFLAMLVLIPIQFVPNVPQPSCWIDQLIL
jgi:hypothetical protein